MSSTPPHSGAPGFGPWIPLTEADVEVHAPDAPAAVQVARADKSLVRYPAGKSAMVFYFYASRSAREALRRVFADELLEPGARGQGPLAFRFIVGGDEARALLERLYHEFEARFRSPPVLHVDALEGQPDTGGGGAAEGDAAEGDATDGDAIDGDEPGPSSRGGS